MTARKPKVRPVLPAGAAQIRLDEQRAVETSLNIIKDPAKRAAKAAAILAEAEKFIEEHYARVKKLGLSLALIDGHRGVSNLIGMSRSGFYQLTEEALGEWPDRPAQWNETVAERARARGVRWYRDPLEELLPLAADVYAAKQRKIHAEKARDQLIVTLATKHGMKPPQLGEIVGRDRTSVHHILRKYGVAVPRKPKDDQD